MTVGTLIMLNLIGATSLHLVIRTGHVSLAHAAFMGVGAYAAVLADMRFGLPFPLTLLTGAAAPALLALLIGPVVLRLTGKYFVLVTFLLGEMLRLVFVQWLDVTGGANGIFGVPAPAESLASPVRFYAMMVVASLACVGLVALLLTSEVGRAVDSVRESERVAECSGIPVLRLKVTIFVLACTLVGVQGGLQAYYLRYVDPSAFNAVQSLNFVVMNVIGGMENLVGPVIGTVFVVLLPEALRSYVEVQQILFGLTLVVVMAFLPGGMVQLITLLRHNDPPTAR
ncbi:MAG: branched-chain amino acid ABC transporter permease [Ramlibacter sp.]